MIERKQVKGISTDYKAYMGEDNPSDLLSQGTVLAETGNKKENFSKP